MFPICEAITGVQAPSVSRIGKPNGEKSRKRQIYIIYATQNIYRSVTDLSLDLSQNDQKSNGNISPHPNRKNIHMYEF